MGGVFCLNQNLQNFRMNRILILNNIVSIIL